MPTPKEGYRLKDGTKVPGTTTVIGRWKESGGLLQWAFQCGKSGQATLYEKRDEAADIGTIAHDAATRYLRGASESEAILLAIDELKADGEKAEKARQAYTMFLRWFSQQRAKVFAVETPLVSESMRIGATPDAVFQAEGRGLAMGDWKTSNAIYRDTLMQVACYGAVWNENHPDDPITDGFHVCRFSKDFPDFEHRYFSELADALACFKLLRQAYDLDLKLKARVK